MALKLNTMKKKVKKHVDRKEAEYKPYSGNIEKMVSTGSTWLDLAISGTRKKGGGLPSGILVEIFGPSSLGKTVMLAEIAGSIQRAGGDVLFQDPEARLNENFAAIFGYKLDPSKYKTPDTVTEMFKETRKWIPQPTEPDAINGIMADSLAALSTNMEMENDEGDKMGGRRAKDFSEQTRKTARFLKRENLLMVCSNQIRQNMNAMAFAEKYTTPGGEAIPFYASLRLRVKKPKKDSKIYTTIKKGKSGEEKRVIGITTEVEVYKSSVDVPFRKARFSIIYNYGIDDIRQNLLFLKEYQGLTSFAIGDLALGKGIEAAIQKVEEEGLEKKLKKEVIRVWEEFEEKIQNKNKRKEKKR